MGYVISEYYVAKEYSVNDSLSIGQITMCSI